MKKKYLYSAGAAGVIGATVAGYFLKDKDKRDNVKRKVKNYQNSIRATFEEAGVPDQSEDRGLEQLENAKMVSEGSQFGVQYYNENKEANTSEYQSSRRGRLTPDLSHHRTYGSVYGGFI
ncbi:hypothetical protein [Virgibacillus sp. Bac330]|uniref:hypothetical protein n=1 Tax=Virgibacillus sp. Bac330 TaxID=2419841 RepID=UPI001F08DD47|nr:hypothetical protein [Virgibacillus sp. Bac330]